MPVVRRLVMHPALEEAAPFPCCRAKRLALPVAELHGPTALNHGCVSWPPEPNQKMPALAATVSAARPMIGATTNRVSVAPTTAPAQHREHHAEAQFLPVAGAACQPAVEADPDDGRRQHRRGRAPGCRTAGPSRSGYRTRPPGRRSGSAWCRRGSRAHPAPARTASTTSITTSMPSAAINQRRTSLSRWRRQPAADHRAGDEADERHHRGGHVDARVRNEPEARGR